MNNKAFKTLTALILILSMLIMTGCQAVKNILPEKEDIKKILEATRGEKEQDLENIFEIINIDSKNIGKVSTQMLTLAKFYYDLSYPKIENNTGDLKLKLPLNPDFKGKTLDKAKSHELSELSASAAITMSMPYFSISSSALAFAYAPDSAFAVHNLAASIRLAIENNDKSVFEIEGLYPLEDSAALYLYSIAIEPERIESYINLGNIFMEMAGEDVDVVSTPYFSGDMTKAQMLNYAKGLFEKAYSIDNESSLACTGMANYYYAKGDRDKWLEWLVKASKGVAFYKKVDQKVEEIETVTKKAGEQGYISGDVAKEAIDQLSKIEVFTTADYFEELSPDIATAIRKKMNSLPKDDVIFKINTQPYVAGVTSYELYSKQYSIAAEDYYFSIINSLEKWREEVSEKKQAIDEKLYSQTEEIDSSIMEELAERLGKGDLSALEEINKYLNSVAPNIDLFPGYDYSQIESVKNSIAVNNQMLLQLRTTYYMLYLDHELNKAQELDWNKKQLFYEKANSLFEQEDAEIEPLSAKLNNADEYEAAIIAKEISKIRNEYSRKRNELRQTGFADLTGEIFPKYPKAMNTLMKMWEECAPLIRFIEDEQTRNYKYYELSEYTVHIATSYMYLAANLNGFGSWEDATTMEWEELNAEQSKIEKQAEEAQKEAIAKAEAEKAYQKIPVPVRALQALLGDTTFSKSFGPISISVSPTNISMAGALIAAGEIGYNWVEDTGKVGLGLGAQMKGKGVGGSASTLLTLTFDANTGNVKEIDWKASADASFDIGVFSLGGGYSTSVMHGGDFSSSLGWGDYGISR